MKKLSQSEFKELVDSVSEKMKVLASEELNVSIDEVEDQFAYQASNVALRTIHLYMQMYQEKIFE